MIVDVKDFDYKQIKAIPLLPKPKGNQAGRKKDVYYKNIICAFDIETSRLVEVEQSVMYIWQFQFGLNQTVIGRTWDEYLDFLTNIVGELNETEYLVIYDHNLSYEFQFLRGIYHFTQEEVFATDNRKILKCKMYNHFEYRCSYFHTNMSLDTFLSKMGVTHKKLTMDYSVRRFSWTKLTDEELAYCVNDVQGLVEALDIEMRHDKDNLYTIPLTSTGYVRRDAKKSMRRVSHKFVSDQLPDEEVYTSLRFAFRGGNTHANRYYSGRIIKDVNSWDRSSSYPDVLCNCDFPVKPFRKIDNPTVEQIIRYITLRHKPVLINMGFYKIRLKDNLTGCPYLSKDKCRNLVKGVFDNGRVLLADELMTTLTDIDFKIVLDQYEWDDTYLGACYESNYGKLPRPLIETVIKYYRLKTELKGVDGQELLYMKSKNKLNSIYGMMAQDPVKQSIIFNGSEFIKDEKPIADILAKNNKKAFLSYAWGVWTTAWSRWRLQEGINIVGDDFIYCDTDSVKYIGDHTKQWEEYNELRKADSIKSGAFATDPHGVTHYMGVYEYEGKYDKFATLGAKKYANEKEGKLEITIAGVNKRKGAEELLKYGGLNAFKTGFIFKEAGGSELVYNDYPEITEIDIDGHRQKITSNVVIRDSTYTLGVTDEYLDILANADLYLELVKGIKLDNRFLLSMVQ